MPFGHEFGPMKLLSSFLAKTHPIHYLRSKTHILGGFTPFGCSKCNVSKSGPRMPFGTSSSQRNFFQDFLPKRIQSTTLGPKLMFWVVSHHLVAANAALPNCVLGRYFGTSLGWPNYCRVFRLKHIQSTTLCPKLTFWVVSHHLVAASGPFRNRILGCRFGKSSGQWNFFQDFLPKCIQSTMFGPKHMFWAVSHHLVAVCRPLQNQVLGCRLGTSLGRWNYCRVF